MPSKTQKQSKLIKDISVKNLSGVVLTFSDIKGYGFIIAKYSNEKVYVNTSNIVKGKSLRKNQYVTFDAVKTKAYNVRLSNKQPHVKIEYGEILFYNQFKQFGFIKNINDDDSNNIYFNAKELYNYVDTNGNAKTPQKGDKIEYILGKYGDKAFEIKRCDKKFEIEEINEEINEVKIVKKTKKKRKRRRKRNKKNKNKNKKLENEEKKEEIITIKIDKKTEENYRNIMNKCGVYETIVNLSETSSYKSNINDGNDPKASNMKKIIKEIRNELSKNICLNYVGGSMFLRMDEKNPRFIQCLLTGLNDTPYAYGLFLFDIYLCHGYPEVPPKIIHITKGSSEIRANFTPGGYSPNLHSSSGKVCLSLLGTWSGPGWQNGVSNVYQLLSTIMFCILGAKHPYYMEPGNGGWEGTIDMNKKEHSNDVRDYDKKVLIHVLKNAILETIKKPYKYFENVIKMFFKCKSNDLIKWIEKCINNEYNISIKDELNKLLNEIKIELNKLNKFEIIKTNDDDDDIDSDLDLDILSDDDDDNDEIRGDGAVDDDQSSLSNKSVSYSNVNV